MIHLKRVLAVGAASLMIAACGNDVVGDGATDTTEVSLATSSTTSPAPRLSTTTSSSSTTSSSTTTTAPEPENGEVLFVDADTSSSECAVQGGLLRLESDETSRFYDADGDLVESFSEDEHVVVTDAGELVTLELASDVALGAGINPDASDFSLTAVDSDGKEMWSVDARYDAPIDGNAARQTHFAPGALVDDLIVGWFTTEESSGSGYPAVISLEDGSLKWFDEDGSFGGVSPGVMNVDGTLRDLATGDELPLSVGYDSTYEQVDDFVVPLRGYSANYVDSASSGAVLFEVEGGSDGNADGVTKTVVMSLSGDDGRSLSGFNLAGGAEAWTISSETVDYSGYSMESVGWGMVMGSTDNDFAVLDAATGEQIETYDAEQITWINDETNVDLKLGGVRSEMGWVGRDNLFTGKRHLLCSPYPQIIATDVPVIGVNEDTDENLLLPTQGEPDKAEESDGPTDSEQPADPEEPEGPARPES